MKPERRSGGPMKQSLSTSCVTGVLLSFDRVGTSPSCRGSRESAFYKIRFYADSEQVKMPLACVL